MSSSHEKTAQATRSRRRADRLFMALTLVVALAAFVLLAWDHLGLGALIFPPPATTAQQVAQSGPYQVTFHLESKLLTLNGDDAVSFTLRDQVGHPLANASIRIVPEMTTMPMTGSPLTVYTGGDGRAVTHLRFSMAGAWRLNLTITAVGMPSATASFPVSVYWT